MITQNKIGCMQISLDRNSLYRPTPSTGHSPTVTGGGATIAPLSSGCVACVIAEQDRA